MRVLSDTTSGQDFFAEFSFRARQLTSLPAADQAVWQIFSQAKELWEAGSDSAERLCILIDHASDSQFSQMMQALAAGQDLPDGLSCLALSGEQFRGQRARPWMALRGNLHLCVHYQLELEAATAQATLSMIPVLAVAKAIEVVSAGSISPEIKWVNDLLLAKHKVAGVLSSSQIQGQRLLRLMFGIGINVEQTPELYPNPFMPEASSLVAMQPEMKGKLPALFHELIAQLDQGMAALKSGASQEIFEQYRARCSFIGHRVTLWKTDTTLWQDSDIIAKGRALELLPDLSLRLEGVRNSVHAGRLTID